MQTNSINLKQQRGAVTAANWQPRVVMCGGRMFERSLNSSANYNGNGELVLRTSPQMIEHRSSVDRCQLKN